jgi:lipopolysaccharide/colanic/teichoic acid biosynthesis glycosyltransferase
MLSPSLGPPVSVAGPHSHPPAHRPPRSGDRAQRALDLVGGSVLLVLLAPVVGLAMLVVKLTSPGPALYSQTRLGRFGRPFRILKIRSMTHNCEKQSGIQWCRANDPRVTRVGWVLRKLHIDEFPQLWNILRGEMSLVGPRPERPEIVAKLEQLLPRYRERLAVRPGLTGLAQVQLPPDTDLESVRRKLRYDLHYVTVGGPWMDVRLLAATAVHVAGLPFGVSRLVLRLPGQPEVEPERLAPAADPNADTVTEPLCHSVHEVTLDAARA